MTSIHVIDALAADRRHDAAALVFEYMAMTQAEFPDRHVPANVDELPAVLATECRGLPDVYVAPGVVLLACIADVAVGCVGLKHLPHLDALELKRFYVRASHRGLGAGRALLDAAHAHAALAGMRHVVLDVMPSRTRVLELYRLAGYRVTEPYEDSRYEMVAMRRAVRDTDADRPDR